MLSIDGIRQAFVTFLFFSKRAENRFGKRSPGNARRLRRSCKIHFGTRGAVGPEKNPARDESRTLTAAAFEQICAPTGHYRSGRAMAGTSIGSATQHAARVPYVTQREREFRAIAC